MKRELLGELTDTETCTHRHRDRHTDTQTEVGELLFQIPYSGPATNKKQDES